MEATTPDPRRDERARDEVTHHDTHQDTRHTEPVRGDGVTHTRVYDEEAARHRFGWRSRAGGGLLIGNRLRAALV